MGANYGSCQKIGLAPVEFPVTWCQIISTNRHPTTYKSDGKMSNDIDPGVFGCLPEPESSISVHFDLIFTGLLVLFGRQSNWEKQKS